MSKKNLARTAIEGGRAGYNTYERRIETRSERRQARDLLQAALVDPEVVDGKVNPARRRIRKEFHDKLNPVYRWLEKQSGRPWDDVRSEVHERFDARTTAGRHILHDHILGHVTYEWERHGRLYWLFSPPIAKGDYVGYDGILRHHKGESYKVRWRKTSPRPTRAEAEIWNWANGRLVRRIGSVAFWFVPTPPNGYISYRQDVRLNKSEIAFYDSLNYNERNKLTGFLVK